VGALPYDSAAFEAIDRFGVAMVVHVKDILSSYNLLDKLITYVKDKCKN